jgi:hypothetical protein
VQRFLALFLCLLLLLQTFSRELLVLDYQVHKERITQLFCVNKTRPTLHCNGKCHLMKQLRQASDASGKAPVSGFAKIKYDVLLPAGSLVPTPAALYPAVARFALRQTMPYTFTLAHGIFHPPSFLG